MLQDTAPSRAHKHDGHLPARVGAALLELAALPGSSDALVARMALANVVEKMGTEEIAEPPGVPSTTVVTAAAPKRRDGMSRRSVPLHLRPDVAAAARRRNARSGRGDASAALRQPEPGYFIEVGARRRAEFRIRRDERAAVREPEAAGRPLATTPATGAPTGARLA